MYTTQFAIKLKIVFVFIQTFHMSTGDISYRTGFDYFLKNDALTEVIWDGTKENFHTPIR